MIIMGHQGLGDHIICNGLMRVLVKKYGKIQVPVELSRYGRSFHGVGLVEYMYRDNPNIEITTINGGHNGELYIKELKKMNSDKYIIIGNDPEDSSKTYWRLMIEAGGDLTYDQGFYHLANIDYNERFEEFYIQRDLEEEERIYNSLVDEGEEYIFIHDDPSRGLHMNREKIRKDLKIIENDPSINFFNYRKLFENATELHLMQAGIHDFCCSIPLPKPDIYVHMYVRNYKDWLWAGSINERIKIL